MHAVGILQQSHTTTKKDKDLVMVLVIVARCYKMLASHLMVTWMVLVTSMRRLEMGTTAATIACLVALVANVIAFLCGKSRRICRFECRTWRHGRSVAS